MRSNNETVTVVGEHPLEGDGAVGGRAGAVRPGSVGGGGGAAQGAVDTNTLICSRSSTQQLCLTPSVAGGQALRGAGAQPAERSASAYAAAVSATEWVDAVVRSLFRHAETHQWFPLVWSTGLSVAHEGRCSAPIAAKSRVDARSESSRYPGSTPSSTTTVVKTATIMPRDVRKCTWFAYRTVRWVRAAPTAAPAKSRGGMVSVDPSGYLGAPG